MAKFKYEGEKGAKPVAVYQDHHVVDGDVIELDEVFSAKARANPSCGLVEVKEARKVTAIGDEEQAALDKEAADKEAAKAEKAQAAADAKQAKKGGAN